jgi:hypothetical protein
MTRRKSGRASGQTAELYGEGEFAKPLSGLPRGAERHAKTSKTYTVPLGCCGACAAVLGGTCRKQGRKPALARQRRLGGFGHGLLLHAGDVVSRLLGHALAHGLNDPLLADPAKVTGIAPTSPK